MVAMTQLRHRCDACHRLRPAHAERLSNEVTKPLDGESLCWTAAVVKQLPPNSLSVNTSTVKIVQEVDEVESLFVDFETTLMPQTLPVPLARRHHRTQRNG